MKYQERMKEKRTMKPVISFVLMLALVLTMTMAPMPVYAQWTDHDRISVATGEPVEVLWDGPTSTTGAIVTNTAIDYYPSSFVFYVDTPTPPAVSNGGSATFLFSTSGGDAYRVNLPSTPSTITVELPDSVDPDGVFILRCQAPQGTAPVATTPLAVNGYLPVGQFARGIIWGSIYSDGPHSSGSVVKFLNGYEDTGVSLGAGGGYVQFEFDNTVLNRDINPFGVDFIIYGNAFENNPEAGAVKVSADGVTWYDLAGSLYYDAKSKNNENVAYKKVTTTSAGFATTGIYYKLGSGNWTKFNTDTGVLWWPEPITEGYLTVSGIFAKFKNSNVTVGGVDWDYSVTNPTITYNDVCLVKDTDDNDDYQFGYFDVRGNGSNYGTAVNPYATPPTANNGGDGFDISWAVDENGEPFYLAGIKYVRAYTTACLNTTGDAFTVPAQFGETSAEVCGIYAAKGTGSGITTTAPSILSVNYIDELEEVVTTSSISVPANMSAYSYMDTIRSIAASSEAITLEISITAGSGENVFVNSAKFSEVGTSGVYTGTMGIPGSTQDIRVIVQSGANLPYLFLLN